ncbi:MAG: hypothetical protein WCV50_02725 [Patescibacteria group bacterium]|jgi:DNA polymerase/3'-5' exonuclease PolX
MIPEINKQIADIFSSKAASLISKGERYRFRALAYSRAARAIESLNEGLDDIYARSWLVGLQRINGIGNRLAHEIENELKKIEG